jgi:hypothetical protein
LSAIVQAQITPSVMKHLINLANVEIQKQLVNGSDMKHANQSFQVQRSFAKLVQAGQILETFEAAVRSQDQVCSWISKVKPSEQYNIETLFYRTEALRLFKCKDGDLEANVKMEAQNMLLTPNNYVKTVNDYYYGSVMNHNANAYGLSRSSKFDALVKNYVQNTLLPKYKEDKLSLEGEGLTIESLRVMRLLSTQIEDKEVEEKIISKIKKSLKKIFKEASSQSHHEGQDFDSFFVITKNAYLSENFDVTHLNYEILSLVNHVSAKISPEQVGLSSKQLSLYRNYFIQKAISSISVEGGCYSLSALKLFSEDVVLEGKKQDVFINGDARLIYNLRNSFGVQAVAKSLKKAEIVSIDDSNTNPLDVTKEAGVFANQIRVDLKNFINSLAVGTYAINFQLETIKGGETYDSKVFRVYEKKERQLSASIVKSGKNSVVVSVDNTFSTDIVYATMQLEEQHPYMQMAIFDKESNSHLIFINCTESLKERIDGKYKLMVYLEDPTTNELYA